MAVRSVRRWPLLLAAGGFGMLLLSLAALLRFPLPATYKIQILTLEGQVKGDPFLAPALALAAGCALLCYAAGFAALQAAGTAQHRRPLLIGLVLIPPLVCAAMLLFIHPTSSLDLYDYLYRGHMAARYDANNFVQTPADLRRLDRLYWYTAWRRATTAYGPLWELLSVAIARLAGTKLFGLVLGFKLSALAGWLLTALAIGLAARPAERLHGLYLWLWNPLVLWELVGAAHNDGWMLAFVLLALASLARRPTLALLLVTAGALFKYPAALLWPPLLAAALAVTPGWGRRLALAGRSVFFSALLVGLAYAPWWAGPDMLTQLRERSELFTSSPLALLHALYREHMPREQLQEVLSKFSTALLGLGLLAASWQAIRRPQQIVMISTALLFWLLIVCTPWFQPWYLSWPAALLALEPRARPALRALGAMSLGALLSYPAFAALRPQLAWPANEAPWQALIVALIYGPPFISLLLSRWRPFSLRPQPGILPHQQQEVA